MGRSLVNKIYGNLWINFPPDKDHKFYRVKEKYVDI